MRQTIGPIQHAMGALGAWVIGVWVRMVGKRVAKADAPWLDGPIADPGPVGADFYERFAQARGLTIRRNHPESGLIPSMDLLQGEGFDAGDVDPAVRHFYERTSAYRLDVWSETRFPARLMLWLLVTTVSRYMNQLNFPIHGLDMSRGMTSDIVELRDADDTTTLRGWFRKVLATGRVIYTGFYMTAQPPGHNAQCIKVVFPLPRGNATVLLRPEIEDGVFKLRSVGRAFGDPGFYRVIEADAEHWKVVYLRSLKEFFEVYVDDAGVLRCDHRVAFFGLTMLRLHYRMGRV